MRELFSFSPGKCMKPLEGTMVFDRCMVIFSQTVHACWKWILRPPKIEDAMSGCVPKQVLFYPRDKDNKIVPGEFAIFAVSANDFSVMTVHNQNIHGAKGERSGEPYWEFPVESVRWGVRWAEMDMVLHAGDRLVGLWKEPLIWNLGGPDYKIDKTKTRIRFYAYRLPSDEFDEMSRRKGRCPVSPL